MPLSSIALASFLFLAPGETGGLKLLPGPDVQALLAESTPEACAVVCEKMPPVPVRNCLRAFGAKILLAPPPDPDADASLRRRQLGIGAWAEGADGSVGEPQTEAVADVRAAERLRALALRCVSATNRVETRQAGRRALHLLHYAKGMSDDPDLIRLELLFAAYELEEALGVPHTPADLPPPPALRAAPRQTRGVRKGPMADEAEFRPVNLFNDVNRHPLGNGMYWAFASTKRDMSILVSGTGDAPPVRFRLWTPCHTNGSWNLYRFTVIPNLPPEEAKAAAEGLAPNPVHWLYRLERRYPDAEPPRQHLVFDDTGAYSPDRRRLRHAIPLLTGGEAGWTNGVRIALLDFYGSWPMVNPAVQDVWYAEVSWGERTEKLKFVWPQGGGENFFALADATDFAGFATGFNDRYDKLREKWEPDDPFRVRVLEPLLDRDAKLRELFTQTTWERPPKVKLRPKPVQKIIFRELGRILDIEYRVNEARKAYLRERLAGRMPEPPPPPGKEAFEANPAGDEEVANDFGGLQLDEETF